MASLKGSQTEKNLLAAFAGESQARNRYTYAAGVAQKEGFEQIAAIFEDTANNEKEHAKVFFKHLEGGDVEITATYPAGRHRRHPGQPARPPPPARRWSGARSTPSFARDRQGRGLHRRLQLLHADRRGGVRARAPLQHPRRPRGEGRGLRARRADQVALPQLRARDGGQNGPQALPGLPAPPGTLRALRPERRA